MIIFQDRIRGFCMLALLGVLCAVFYLSLLKHLLLWVASGVVIFGGLHFVHVAIHPLLYLVCYLILTVVVGMIVLQTLIGDEIPIC